MQDSVDDSTASRRRVIISGVQESPKLSAITGDML